MAKSLFFLPALDRNIGMGRALYAQFATARRFVDQCDKLFHPLVGCSIKALCFDASIDHEKKIHQTQYTQPALFTLEYAIARLWMSWGIAPTVVLGHSIGEIAAAAVAGLFYARGCRQAGCRSRPPHAVGRARRNGRRARRA